LARNTSRDFKHSHGNGSPKIEFPVFTVFFKRLKAGSHRVNTSSRKLIISLRQAFSTLALTTDFPSLAVDD
jgi:hypothetical protein